MIETSARSPEARGNTGARRAARSIRVRGIVQGVGFRPFVHGLATRLGLGGFVGNDGDGVTIEAEGAEPALARFLESLAADAPPLAQIESIEVESGVVRGRQDFRILESRAGERRDTPVSPDAATCDDCLRELFDPADRRHLYPFLNCTSCGPRFTIARDVPWDRPRTTMAGFPLCVDCEREYHDPADRRFHAQPIACPACGPRLRLLDREGRVVAGDPIEATAACLREGAIVAVKGLGGYHLAADAAKEPAVAALRARKHREDKPFAVMAGDPDAARALAAIDDDEARVLAGWRRPVVLLRRRPEAALAPSVAPGNRRVGVMLPYTPLHHLLARAFGAPFVLTSGNVSDEPIAWRDDEARTRLSAIADVFLVHDRPIETRTDDSVVRVFRGNEMPIRRSRGYAPEPLSLPVAAPRPILACGAGLKNTFTLAKGRRAFVSHHVGDLANWETLRAFTEGIAHFERLFDVRPEVVAYDLHPEYLSTKHALGLSGVDLVGVQHHHAHVASCLADHGETGPAIGVAFDGLGYGTDGAAWGGEVLVADLAGSERVAHLETVGLPGGDAATREPWRMAAAWLARVADAAAAGRLEVAKRNRDRWDRVWALAGAGLTPRTSSVGRLFDAVAALVGVRDRVSYEGQAAIELEQRADERCLERYDVGPGSGAPIRIPGGDLVRAVVADLEGGVPVGTIAARFHNGLASAIADVCRTVRTRYGLSTVALSGGVFQNALLLERTVDALETETFRVLVHRRVPCNDGGISFGQAAVAAAREGERPWVR